jgi:hypothetical protein
MKIKLEKSVVIKLTIIAMLVIAAPFLIPFVTEFLVFADLMGLEALILFLAYQARHAFAETTPRVRVATAHLTKTLVYLSTVYVMQPRVFLTHSIASSVIIIFACSAFLALAIWLPPLYLSLYGSGFI